MRIRTCLLAAFGVVVPLLAMFSHWIPRNVSAAVWQTLTKPAATWLATEPDAAGDLSRSAKGPLESNAALPPLSAVSETEGSVPTDAAMSALPLPRRPDDRAEMLAFAEVAGVAPMEAAARSPVLPTVSIATDEPLAAGAFRTGHDRPGSAYPPSSFAPPMADQAAAAGRSVVEQAALHQQASRGADASGDVIRLRAALEQLGAFDITHESAAGGGLHRCSCRLVADPTGQLQRVFHASDPDLRRAMQRMVGEVMAWQRAHPNGLKVEFPPSASPLEVPLEGLESSLLKPP